MKPIKQDNREIKERILKMFIWQGVLTDYTSGMVAIYAYDLEHALKIARKKFDGFIVDDFAGKKPIVCRKPDGYYVYGGS